MYKISKIFEFSASHQLLRVPPDHPCHNLHGHNYRVEIILASETLDARGFVIDYHDLKPLKNYIDSTLDHKHLNAVLGDGCVTAEELAKHFFEWCKVRWSQTVSVRVSETGKTWAEYTPERLPLPPTL